MQISDQRCRKFFNGNCKTFLYFRDLIIVHFLIFILAYADEMNEKDNGYSHERIKPLPEISKAPDEKGLSG